MNIVFQSNAKKGWSKELDLLRIYSTPGLFLKLEENSQDGLIQAYTKKELKQLKKTKEGT